MLLGLFNLLPVPPLDGSKVLAGFLPAAWAKRYLALGRAGPGALLLFFAAVLVALWLFSLDARHL
jgi:Zn-dependent protease